MELYIAFLIFVISMIAAIFTGVSMIIALLIGLLAFSAVAFRKGYSLKQIFLMGIDGTKNSIIVIKVMFIIGFITAIWRVSGTITIFVYYGMKIITPPLFLIIAFLLSCLLSYALGTSFGIAGTVGVIFMALARSGNVDPVIAAGVLMSGIYFGDRCSPVSSSANMVAGITNTKIYDNVKQMMRVAVIPLCITFIIYLALSIANPISHVDTELVSAFENEFVLSLWSFLPAAIMLLLPLLKVSVLISMSLSIVSGICVSCFVQKVAFIEVIKICFWGYNSGGSQLGVILNGGGLVSMLEIIFILIISSFYSGIFNGTNLLSAVQEKLNTACTRFGRFVIMLILSIFTAAVFCNQTIATLMCSDLLKKPYLDNGASNEELAIDMENSVILIGCFIPWSIGCSVPLSFMGADFRSLPFAVYMYAVPICYLFMKKRWYKEDKAPKV